MNKLLLCFGFICLFNSISCQSSYETLFREGLELFKQKKYYEARGLFNAASLDPDRPRDGIVENYLDTTTVLAFQVLQDARDSIALNERRVTEQLIRTEANRLGLLSTMAYGEKKYDEALILAVQAMKLSPDSTALHIKKAFGEAVKFEMSDTIFRSKFPIDNFWLQDSHYEILVSMKDSILSFISIEGDHVMHRAAGPILSLEAKGSYTLLGLTNGHASILKNAGKIAELVGHRSEILAINGSVENSLLITGSRDSSAVIWNTEGNQMGVLKGHEAPIYATEISPDQTSILTRAADGTARLWSKEGQLLATLNGENWYMDRALFSPNGKEVITTTVDGNIQVWDGLGKLKREWEGHKTQIELLEYFEYGRLLITCGLDSICKIWRSEDGSLVDHLKHNEEINSVFVHPQKKVILTCAADGRANIWNYKGDLLRSYQDHFDEVVSGEANDAGNLWLTNSKDGTARLWDNDQNLLMRIDLATNNPASSSHFSANNETVITILNKSVISTPLPNVALERLLQKMPYTKEHIEKVLVEYNVQEFSKN